MPNGSIVANVYTDYRSETLDHGEPIAQIRKNNVDLTRVSASCPVGEAVSTLEQYMYTEFIASQSHDVSMTQEVCPCADTFALMTQSSHLSNALLWT